MIFQDYYITSELNNWQVESDISWSKLDRELMKNELDLLEKIKTSCLIESHHPVSTGRLLTLLEDDVDATAIVSIELYEGFKHFYSLKKYLALVDHPKVNLTDEDIRRARLKALKHKSQASLAEELVTFMVSEHFAAYFFLRIAEATEEPVLKQLSKLIARDEFRHTQAAYAITLSKLQSKKISRNEVLKAAHNFQHYGTQIADEIPVFQKNDILAIHSFIKKIETMTGERMVDYVKKSRKKK